MSSQARGVVPYIIRLGVALLRDQQQSPVSSTTGTMSVQYAHSPSSASKYNADRSALGWVRHIQARASFHRRNAFRRESLA
jgi:hypothetical protein